jgi:hypothetical protein
MKYFLGAATGIFLTLSAVPAVAQLSAQGAGAAGATPQIQPRVPDLAPNGVPGAGNAPIATGPVIQKSITGDPTVALFTAVNGNDYDGAQNALSHGANLYALNPLGETPLDLSIALNRTTITFLLLATRNETGGNPDAGAPLSPTPASAAAKPRAAHRKPAHVTPVAAAAPVMQMGNNPGTPDPSSGFLGFGSNSQ